MSCLIGPGKVSRTVIFGLSGAQYAASPSFKIALAHSEARVSKCADVKYVITRADDRSNYGTKDDKIGFYMIKTTQAVFIAVYNEGIDPGSCVNVVEELGD
ncbi:profilin [Circinella umbellata]|nr:profilin [Circinella umbellata]